MSSKLFCIVSLLAGSLLAGSALAKSKEPVDLSDIGPQPADALQAITEGSRDYLKDPDSAQFEVGTLHPAYCKKGWAKGNGVEWKGWAANIMINARNAFGGYTGFQSHTVLFSGGRAVRFIEGGEFGAYGPSKGLLGGGAGVCTFVRNPY